MIGERIKQLREQKGYSISELARLADISKSYLSQIEKGLQSNPSLQFLNKVTATLETNLDYLLGNPKLKTRLDNELDEEWKSLIRQGINDGLKKEDFQEYINYIKFQAWMKEQDKNKQTNLLDGKRP